MTSLNSLYSVLLDDDSFDFSSSSFPNAFLYAVFVMVDRDGYSGLQFDFFDPKSNKLISFSGDDYSCKVHEELLRGIPKPLVLDGLALDLDGFLDKVVELLQSESSSLKPSRIIAVLSGGLWNLTCMDEMLGMVQLKVDAMNLDVLSCRKGSLMDVVGFSRNS
jgi:hypothetical protein